MVVRGALIEELARLESSRARTALLRRHPEIWQTAVVDQLYADVVRLTATDLQRADRLARAALWLAVKIGDDAARGQSLRAVGHVAFSHGRHREALRHYNAALTLFRQLGRDVDVARTLNGALQTHISMGKYDAGLASAEEARAILEKHGDELGLARLDMNVGNILYRRDRLEEALALYERAHAQFVRVGQPNDVAAALGNMALVYGNLNDFDRAIESHRQARAYYELHQMQLLIARVDYNIAYLYYLRGEYARALDLYRRAQEQCDEQGDRYISALCDLDQSEIYLELNLSDQASDLGERARAHFHELGMAYDTAKAVTNVAIAVSNQGDVPRARTLFGQARRLFAKEENELWLALVDFYQALVLHRNGRGREARRLCLSALERFARASAPGRAGLCGLLLARLELDAGNLAEAGRACAAAFKTLAGAASPSLMYQAYFVRGLIAEGASDTAGAHAEFEKAHAELEHLRSHLQAEDHKIAFLKDKLAVYESLVTTSLALDTGIQRIKAAFRYIEEAKSRGLADLIAFRAATLEPRSPGAVSEKVHRLRHDLNWHYRRVELEDLRREKRSARRVESLQLRATQLEKELARSLDELRRTDEEFVALQSGAAQDLDAIQSSLAADTLLLEYYQARGQYYVCIVGRERLEIVPLGDAGRMRQLVALLHFQLSKFRLDPAYVAAVAPQMQTAAEHHLRELYDVLVAPIRRRLDAAHLVVVGHDILHAVPFHALLAGDRFLIDDFTVSYAPSASVYRLCCAKEAAARGTSLIMGVPDSLAPCIVDEVREIAGILPNPRLFVGEEATVGALRAHGPTSQFVHVATHGLFRRDNPMFSSIRLGDGPLCVYDLYELRLSADLVTLSGCSTGLNVVVGGDELLGLVRGLLYAGARAVLLTLWDASDRSTAEFMAAFYRHLRDGMNKARAVQRATAEIRARYPHPFYWAPFALVGDALSDVGLGSAQLQNR